MHCQWVPLTDGQLTGDVLSTARGETAGRSAIALAATGAPATRPAFLPAFVSPVLTCLPECWVFPAPGARDPAWATADSTTSAPWDMSPQRFQHIRRDVHAFDVTR
jgi:hypothetical protein